MAFSGSTSLLTLLFWLMCLLNIHCLALEMFQAGMLLQGCCLLFVYVDLRNYSIDVGVAIGYMVEELSVGEIDSRTKK